MSAPRTPRRTAATLVVAAGAAVAVMGLAACSGDRADDASATTSTVASASGETSAVGDPVAASAPVSPDAVDPGDLFVVEGTDGTAEPDGDAWTVTMVVDADVLAFTDRPARGASRMSPSNLVEDWASYGFADDPPNAALTAEVGDGDDVDLAVELAEPRWDEAADRLTVTARPIGDDIGAELPTSLDSVRLFIDDAGQDVELWISVQAGGPVTVLDAGGTQLTACTQVYGGQNFLVPPGCNATVANPTPGVASSVSMRFGSTSVNWLTIEWDVTIQFEADGTVSGTVSMPQPPSPDYAFWPLLADYEQLTRTPGAVLPLQVRTVDGQPHIDLWFMSTAPSD